MTETPDETIARLTAGADPTPVDPAAWPTPGQWIARFNAATAEERLEIVATVIELSQSGAACMDRHHREHLDEKQHTIAALHADLHRLMGASGA